MPFTSRWPDGVKAAAVALVLERGWTAREAWTAALEGKLQHKGQTLAPARGLPLGTVRDWARIARLERAQLAAAAAGPDAFLSRHVGELVGMLDSERAKARRRLAAGKAGPDVIGQLAKAGREVAQLARAIQPRSGSPRLNGADDGGDAPARGSSAGKSDTPAEGSFIDALAAQPDA